MLEDNNGSPLTTAAALNHHCHAYFSEIFSSHHPQSLNTLPSLLPRVVLEEDSRDFLSSPSIDEIGTAVFAIGSNKALGPDGFNGKFYREFWVTLKEDIVTMVHHFFQECVLSALISETTITLVPKLEAPLRLKDFRPISLCNVLYKTISKILTNRIRPILSRFISDNQCGFLPGRSMIDNIVLALEMTHLVAQKHRENGVAALKV